MKIFLKHPSYIDALKICQTLQSHGYEAVFAGGCVRDALLGVNPKDFDIATSARPEQVEKIFEKVIDVGRAFGVMLVVQPSGTYEVASFRSDGDYEDGRRPNSIAFSSLKEDALRRDFTVNAMYFDAVKERLIDEVGGQADLKARCLRTVGDPSKRFKEDHLRILRALRFASQLDFNIEPQTWQQVCEMIELLKTVSKERITEELSKLWMTKNRVKGLRLLLEAKALEVLLPEVHKMFRSFRSDQLETFMRLWALPDRYEDSLALWALFFSGFREEAEGVFDRTWPKLTFSKKAQRYIKSILESLKLLADPNVRMGSKLQHMGSEYGVELLKVASYWNQLEPSRFSPNLDILVKRLSKVTTKSGALVEPFLTGDDLLSFEIKKGPLFGALLKEAFHLQLEGELLNRSEALEWLKTRKP